MSTIRVAIADDHQLVVDGIKALLEGESEVEVVGTASNGNEALQLIEALTVRVVLMDIDMPEMNGLEATKSIKNDSKDVKVIILTMHNEKSVIRTLMQAGADGYLLKNTDKEDLVHAIKKVHAGETFFSPDVTNSLLHNNSDDNETELSQLTEREVEILKLLAEGCSNKEIGEQLFISHRTVDTHRTNLMRKLNVHNVAGLIRFALKNNLTD